METLIIPEEKDIERAKGLWNKTRAQKNTIIKSIKDINKAMRRGVAWCQVDKWERGELFRKRLIELGASEEQLKQYDDSVTYHIQIHKEKYEEAEHIKRAKIAESIPKGLVKNIGGDKRVSAVIKNRRRYGRIYDRPYMSNQFQGREYYLIDNEDKCHSLGYTFNDLYGNDNYRYRAKLIIEHKIKSES